MPKIVWDAVGEKLYETGISKGVLYPRDADGLYPLGVPWNGLTGVTESPSGAEATAKYADNIKYGNLLSAEEFAATVKRSRILMNLRNAMAPRKLPPG